MRGRTNLLLQTINMNLHVLVALVLCCCVAETSSAAVEEQGNNEKLLDDFDCKSFLSLFFFSAGWANN